MRISAMRSNTVVFMVLAFYFITVVLALVLVDKVIYQQRKQSIIFDRWQELFNIDGDAIIQAANAAVSSSNEDLAQRYREHLQILLEREFSHANGPWRIRASGPGGSVVAQVEDRTRFAQHNTWRNSLFFRNFSKEIRWRSALSGARVTFEYTTPISIPEIEALTHRYRMIALLVWGAITVGFGLVLRYVVFPIRRVMTQVQGSGAELLRRPQTALERGYNAVATEALAARLSQRITELVQTPSLWTSAEFDPPMIQAVREVFGFQAAALLVIEPTSPAIHLRALDAIPAMQRIEKEIQHSRIKWEDLEPGHDAVLDKRLGEQLGRIAAVVPVLETASSRAGLFVIDTGDWSQLSRWHRQVIEAAASEVRRGLIQMPVFRDYLFRQKSQANISLARSLGHDLTNVIATSKFDILAIQSWLRKRQRAQEESGEGASKRETILAESVQGLLNTTKFMQEIVNIYRAFSYMDEPKWERIDLNGLVEHLSDLFRLTLSRRVEVQVTLDPDLPAVMCEPRLIQLALFNLLTNANQAIKRQGENEAGAISIGTARSDDGHVEITVRDSGPGIRGAEGELLDGEALYQIFFLGITMRREGEDKGEGLGLNWVWSIIRDFHAGGVRPANHPDGGAVFHLTLPIEGNPAKMPDETNSGNGPGEESESNHG